MEAAVVVAVVGGCSHGEALGDCIMRLGGLDGLDGGHGIVWCCAVGVRETPGRRWVGWVGYQISAQ